MAKILKMAKKKIDKWLDYHVRIGRRVAFYDQDQKRSFYGIVISRDGDSVLIKIAENTIRLKIEELTPIFSDHEA